MLFNSWAYLVFLPVVLAVYWLTPQKYRWLPLLIASYYFYMSWNAKLVVLIGTTTLVSYLAALAIAAAKTQQHKKWCLCVPIFVSLGILFYYKYFNFFSLSVTQFLRAISLPVDDFTVQVMLPVGISFYTFQTLSYVIDVYTGALKPERHLGIYALYVSFFPQLVAGPIERATNLLPQFHRAHSPNAEKWAWGLRMIVWGLFKKMVIADSLAEVVDRVYSDIHACTPMTLLLATVLFAVQIYCDFSGYSDVALGSAKLLDFDLMQNFNTPYFSKTLQEFWKRWHISLSSWFESYVFTPFVWGNPLQKVPVVGKYFTHAPALLGILLVFFCSGLWHGAAWTFILWGCFHGVCQVVSNLTKKRRKKLRKKWHIREKSLWYQGWQMLFVFGLVCMSYVLFRANTIADAMYIFMQLPKVVWRPIANLQNSIGALALGQYGLQQMLLLLAVLLGHDAIQYRYGDPFVLLAKQHAVVRFIVTYLLGVAVIFTFLTLAEGASVDFIYFQF